MSSPTPEEIKARQDGIRQKRIATLAGSFQLLKARYQEIADHTHLSNSMAAAAAEEYLIYREVLVKVDNIKGRIQRHKIAGLMAAAILKARPIQLVPEDVDSKAYRHSCDNEIFAVLHGIAICAEGKTREEIRAITSLPIFATWFSETVHLFHCEPSDKESFVSIFGTLSMTYFPDNWGHKK